MLFFRSIAFIFLLICTQCFAASSLDNSAKKCVNTTYSIEVEKQLPFLWFFAERDILDPINIQSAKTGGDPLRLIELVYRLEYWGCQRAKNNDDSAEVFFNEAKKLVDFIIDKYQPALRDDKNLYIHYKNSHNEIKAGWWSAMDGFLVPLVLENSSIIFDDAKYRIAAKKAFYSVSRPVNSGGSVWWVGGKSDVAWLSEYSWPEMTEKDEYWVLNGHLYALQALKLYAMLTKDLYADNLYEAAFMGTVTKINQFNSMRHWTLYMLNPKTINQTHYVIFEKLLFDSLFLLTNNSFFKEHAQIRINKLKASTPINMIKRNDGIFEVTLLRATPPHPYNIDMYRTELKCYDVYGEKVIDEFSLKLEQQFLVAHSDKEPKKCDVYAHVREGLAVFLFSTSDLNIKSGLVLSTPDFSVKYDAVKKYERNFEIDPNLVNIDRGELNIEVHNKSFDQTNGLFGFDMDVSERVNFGVVITDSAGKEFFRYYPALERGKNLVILSPLGFNNIEEAVLPFKKIDLHIYTGNQNKRIYGRIGNIFFSKNATDLSAYIKKLAPIYTPHE